MVNEKAKFYKIKNTRWNTKGGIFMKENVQNIYINGSGMIDYITILYEEKIVIYQGKYALYEINMGINSGISGVCFLDGILFFTKAGENNLYALRSYDRRMKVYQAEDVCKEIKLLNCVKGSDMSFLMEVYRNEKRDMEVYTIHKNKLHKEYVLPYKKVLDVGKIKEKSLIIEVCDELEEKYDEDKGCFYSEYIAIAKIYTGQKNEPCIDTLGVVLEEDKGKFKAFENSSRDMHFPLVSFLNNFSKYLGLTSEANMIIYYNRELNSLILSSVHNSEIEYLIQLPEKYAETEEIIFFFNEQSKILTVCHWRKMIITRYMIKRNSEDLHKLNKIYSCNQSQKICCDKRFTLLEKAFYKVLFGTTLEEIANIEIYNRENDDCKEKVCTFL